MTPETFIAQREFDEKYITSTEVRNRLGMTRPVLLHYRQRGKLPNEITLQNGQLILWEREAIESHLVAIEAARASRNNAQ